MTTYYVSTTGSDSNPGTTGSRWATLQKAANTMVAGDTTLVGDGVYTTSSDRFVDMNRAGTSAAWITFKSENPNGAKIDGRNITDYMLVARPNVGAFFRFQDFDIYGFRHIAIVTTQAHDIEIIGNQIHDIGRYCSSVDEGYDAFYARSAYNIRIEGNTFYNIGRYGPGENGCTPSNTFWQNHDHGVYLAGGNTITVIGNTFTDFNRGWAIHIYSGEGLTLTGLTVDSNVFTGPNPNRAGQIVLSTAVSNSTILGNSFYYPNTAAISTRPVTYTNVSVRNNTIYNAAVLDTPVSGITVSNNTLLQGSVIYYVSGSGNDSFDGKTIAKAKRTLQAAHALTVAGDVVYALNGDYTKTSAGSAVLDITRSGTSAGVITYKNYPGHSPRIRVGSQNWQGIKITANYITIDGFEVYGNAENITYAYAYSERNNGNNSSTSADGMLLDGRTVGTRRNVIFRNNTVHHMPGGGIAVVAADYVTIENNRAYSNSWWTPYANSGISIYSSRHVDNVTSYKNFVRRNTCWDNENYIGFISAGGVITDGNGIIIDDNLNDQSTGVAYIGKTLVTNNLCYNNGGTGMHAYSCANVDFINNTAWANCRSPAINNGEIIANTCTSVNLHNNILYARTGKNATTNNFNSGVSYNYNIYFNGAVSVTGANDLTADPLFVSAPTDFRLQSGSPAINSGTSTLAPTDDITGASRGSSVDRGAYEYVAVVVAGKPKATSFYNKRRSA